MRILHTCEFYYPHIGGAQEVVREVSERLAARGHEVTVATQADRDRNFRELNGVAIVGFPISGNLARGLHGPVNDYLDFLRQPGWDGMMNYALQQWSMDIAMLALQELPYATLGATCGFAGLHDPAYTAYFRQLPAMLKRYDGLIFHSGTYRDAQFAAAHGLSHAHVIPNAVREEEFILSPPPDFRARHGIAEDHLLILCVANYTGSKGQPELLDAFAAADTGPATLLLVGKNFIDPDRSMAEALPLEKLGDGKRALALQLPRAEVIEAYFAADIFALLSQVECSPLVLFEAAAAGLPFLATEAGNSREIAEWTGAGQIVPGRIIEDGLVQADIPAAARALEALAKDGPRRCQMGEAGRAAVLERFTWGRITDCYEALYAEMADKSAMRRRA